MYQPCASEGAHVLTASSFPTFFKLSVTLCCFCSAAVAIRDMTTYVTITEPC